MGEKTTLSHLKVAHFEQWDNFKEQDYIFQQLMKFCEQVHQMDLLSVKTSATCINQNLQYQNNKLDEI